MLRCMRIAGVGTRCHSAQPAATKLLGQAALDVCLRVSSRRMGPCRVSSRVSAYTLCTAPSGLALLSRYAISAGENCACSLFFGRHESYTSLCHFSGPAWLTYGQAGFLLLLGILLAAKCFRVVGILTQAILVRLRFLCRCSSWMAGPLLDVPTVVAAFAVGVVLEMLCNHCTSLRCARRIRVRIGSLALCPLQRVL